MKKNDISSADYIRFNVAGNCYGLAFASLLEVADPVVIAPLPFSESYVDGLVNINSQMMLQLDVALLLHAKTSSTKQALLIVEVDGESFALAVDSVGEPIAINATDLQQAETKTIGELALQVLPECKVINPLQLKRLFSVNRILPKTNSQAVFQHDWQEQVQEQEYEFLQFRLNQKTFAVALTDLLEIIDIESLQKIAKSPSLVVGVSLLRGQPRLLLDLAQLLKLDKPCEGKSSLMVHYQGYVLGLMVNEALGVLKIPESDLRYDDQNLLTAVNYQNKPVEVLDLKTLLTLDTVKQLKPFLTLAKQQQEQQVVYQELLMLEVAGETLAVRLENASRISYQGKLSLLPEADGFIYATMEYRGSVIPVLDLPKLLGLQPLASDASEFLIVSCESQHWALKIDQSLRIVEVPEKTISYTDSKSGYLLGFCEVEQKLLAILNIDNICLNDGVIALADK